jgi:hypothetical protein
MREILKGMSRVHDPLGLIAPAILPARILMQDVWQHRCVWDEPLESKYTTVWTNWIAESKLLKNLRIPRCFRKKHIQQELHAFSDASLNGYGACVYL